MKEWWDGELPTPEQVWRDRMFALLRDLIRTEGKVRAAELLKVNYRTLDRAYLTGRLTGHMAKALDSHLLQGGDPAVARLRERVDALEGAMQAASVDGEERLARLEQRADALASEQAEAQRRTELRLAGLEAAGRSGTPVQASGAGRDTGGGQAAPAQRRYVPPRPYPDVVTWEPEEGEERFYGEAIPLIAEWRQVRARMLEFDRGGRWIPYLEAQQRVLELELVLIETHELTLPPFTYPWDRLDRRDHLRRKRAVLGDVAWLLLKARTRRWARRVLTFGLWWD